mgnify:CR=1 FL=1
METDLEELTYRTVRAVAGGDGNLMSRWASILASTIMYLISTGSLDPRGLSLLLRLFWQAGKDDLEFDGTDQDNCLSYSTDEMYKYCMTWLDMFNQVVTEEGGTE